MKESLVIYSSETGQKELFKPISETQIGVYHCGPTVYWNQHIGNMRSAVVGDLVWRGLEFLYPESNINFVRNYTDVGHLTGDNLGDADTGEDRMDKASKREGVSPDQIASKYIRQYEADLASLNCKLPYMMRATDHIQDMIELTQKLIEKGYAYKTPLAIYFDISKKADYTRLSRQDINKLLAGHGHGSVEDTNKKKPR